MNIVTTVNNSVNHFPIDAVAQVSGTAACRDLAYYVGTSRKVAEEREKFYNFLKDKGFYVLKSQTNFLFARHPDLPGDQLYQKVKQQGLLIRHFATKGIEDFVRITIGTPEQMEVLKQAIENIVSC